MGLNPQLRGLAEKPSASMLVGGYVPTASVNTAELKPRVIPQVELGQRLNALAAARLPMCAGRTASLIPLSTIATLSNTRCSPARSPFQQP